MARRPKLSADQVRQRILEHCQTLRVPLDAAELDALLGRAEKERFSHLELVEHLLAAPAHRFAAALRTLDTGAGSRSVTTAPATSQRDPA